MCYSGNPLTVSLMGSVAPFHICHFQQPWGESLFLDIPRDACHFVKYNLIGTARNTATSSCHRLQFVSSIYVHKRDWQQMERDLRSICLDSTAAHEFGCQWSICQSLCFRLHFVCVASPCEHRQHSSLGGPCRRGCRQEQPDWFGSPPVGSVTVTPS